MMKLSRNFVKIFKKRLIWLKKSNIFANNRKIRPKELEWDVFLCGLGIVG